MPTDYLSDVQTPKVVADSNDKDAKSSSVASISNQLTDLVGKISDKIKASESILVALSKDPSVDEIAAALGLTMILDRIGKHVTAIYSGHTPNTLEFLKPDDTFEKDTNSLQDFIVAINKDKADHLRYKIEGDYVKVYITPYRTMITEKDLEFDRGDYNVDLVITIDVKSGESIDGALSEYGRIMHDATAINITTDVPGRFAETEWSDPDASSVCEMIVTLADKMGFDDFTEPIATALLTGIVAATDRFSNEHTAPSTMSVASRLMSAGADQQLISTNIMKESLGSSNTNGLNTISSSDTQIAKDGTSEIMPDTDIVIEREPSPMPAPELPVEMPAAATPVETEPMESAPVQQPEPIIAPEPAPAPATPDIFPQPILPVPDMNSLPPTPEIDFSTPAVAPTPVPAPVSPEPALAPQPAPITPEPTPAPIPAPAPATPAPAPISAPAPSITSGPVDPTAFHIPGAQA